VALNQLMFFHGLMRTSPVHASLIMVATPILVLVMSGILIGERIVAGKVAGVIAGAVGASLLIMLRDPDDQTSSLMGDVFILINASAFGIYLVMVKPLMARYSAVTVMSWTFLIGTMLVLPFGAGELASVRWTALSNGQVAAMTFVVVMVTFVAYLLNTWALGVVHPSVVGSFIYLQPVFATAIALLGNDHVHVGLPQAVSAVLIFLGVHLVTRADRRERAID
jgi:drug/metabolite transporter (DMT)-like permease